MAQANSDSTTRRPVVGSHGTFLATDARVPIAAPGPGTEASDPIFAAIDAHSRALRRRNEIIEAICAAEESHKIEEREAWQTYERQ
jgi:hypothetical protein